MLLDGLIFHIVPILPISKNGYWYMWMQFVYCSYVGKNPVDVFKNFFHVFM